MGLYRTIINRFLTFNQRQKLSRIRGVLLNDNAVAGLLFSVLNKYYKTNHCRFVYPHKMIPLAFRSRFFFNTYERPERKLLKKYIKKNHNVLELGACLGIVSCVTNKLLSKESRHLVVEANPHLIPWIEKNRDLNNCNFSTEFCAVAEGKEVTFYLHESIVGGSAQRKTGTATVIPAKSIKDLESKYGTFNALIMDIEGGEHYVIKNSMNELMHYDLLIVEMHDFIGEELIEECRKILSENKFRLIEKIGNNEAWSK